MSVMCKYWAKQIIVLVEDEYEWWESMRKVLGQLTEGEHLQ